MDTIYVLQLLGSFVLGGALSAGVAFLWLRARVKRDQARLLHVEQARQLAAQQVTQARKQVEQLQRDCHELRLAVRPTVRAAPAAAMTTEVPLDAVEIARRHLEAKLAGPAPAPKGGTEPFPDTLLLRPGPR